MPRQWRGMYPAGGASTNQSHQRFRAPVDFWATATAMVLTSFTAAASNFQRGATRVAGYVSRWQIQHKSIPQRFRAPVDFWVDDDINGICKSHGGSVPFPKGCHASTRVCTMLSETAHLNLSTIRTIHLFSIPKLHCSNCYNASRTSTKDDFLNVLSLLNNSRRSSIW